MKKDYNRIEAVIEYKDGSHGEVNCDRKIIHFSDGHYEYWRKYDNQGRIIKETTMFGETKTFEYCKDGSMIETSHRGIKTRRVRDKNGLWIPVHKPEKNKKVIFFNFKKGR